jgi:hypothetical protein
MMPLFLINLLVPPPSSVLKVYAAGTFGTSVHAHTVYGMASQKISISSSENCRIFRALKIYDLLIVLK